MRPKRRWRASVRGFTHTSCCMPQLSGAALGSSAGLYEGHAVTPHGILRGAWAATHGRPRRSPMRSARSSIATGAQWRLVRRAKRGPHVAVASSAQICAGRCCGHGLFRARPNTNPQATGARVTPPTVAEKAEKNAHTPTSWITSRQKRKGRKIPKNVACP